ncbi:thiamine phosphate synthase [Neorhizobium sp. JUb45]|uniref:thiamine phosphate synthase n=1 Tax=unclassified Neorhizobium TaxID=2629175 RepID=UPI0010434594|nr:thiamine phosphate synthase [Neorhizobium sp. JUb45]TCQ98201.1 thiamine-phosphate diphosphorylase [Neorhizobium sp. JUb45]
MTIDYRLNPIVDAGLADIGNLPELAAIAAKNGATLIQYRDKTGSTGAMIERAKAILEALRGTGVPLVVNDRVDVALAAGADGVHLGADDMDAATARRLLGPAAIIGLTVKTPADAERAGRAAASYACIGGVFETLSKHNPDPPVGLDGFRRLRAQLRTLDPGLPVGAIAGIGLRQVPDVIAAGADGVAVISAIFRAPDIATACRDFRHAVDHALKGVPQ